MPLGSDCGTVDTAVASDARWPGFKSVHRYHDQGLKALAGNNQTVSQCCYA